MSVPGNISLRRVWLVARRDYFGYIKTWGFWISFFLPVLFGLFGFVLAMAGVDLESTRYEAILDETGQGYETRIIDDWRAREQALQDAALEALPDGLEAAARDEMESLDGNLVFVPAPADTMEELRPYLRGERTLTHDGRDVALSGLLQIVEGEEGLEARYWSRNINAPRVPAMASRYFRTEAQKDYLESGGLSLEGWAEATRTAYIDTFDPTQTITADEEVEAVSQVERVPYYIAGALTVFLWLTVFSGAYMLLTSMLEEKLGKLMEMMLATTQFAEIMLGKLLGVALLTLTAMAPYILLVIGGTIAVMTLGPPEMVEGIREAVTLKMIIFFPVFLLLGYVLYGSLFIALGSLSESMQDAQTLTVPIMIILTACVLVVPAGFSDPNAPLVVFASWFPLSAPFAAIVRLPSDPSWLTLIGSAMVMLASTMLIAWLASRVFRHGILSGSGVKSLGVWFRRAVLRRNAT